MKLSVCDACGQLLQFEHTACRRCGAPLGFIPEAMILTALATRDDGLVTPLSRSDEAWRRCVNAEAVGCNWLLPAGSEEVHCAACRLNRNLADLTVPRNREKWRALEAAKRRLVYALLRFGVPIASQKDGEPRGLAFDFLAGSHGAPVDTGAGFGLSVNPRVGEDPRNAAVIDFDPYQPPDLASLTRAWLPLTAAVNSLNRSMGQPDLYPLDPSPNVLAKVRFIHELLHPPRNRTAA